MFTSEVPFGPYVYPWIIPFDQRLRMLIKGTVRVAYFYHTADNSTFRYRVYNMVEAINAADGPVSAAWFTYDDTPRLDFVLENCDWLVVCRVPYTLVVRDLITSAKKRGIRVVFDCDDLVFDPARAPLIMDALGQDTSPGGPWESWFGYMGRLHATMIMCDQGSTSTKPLARELEQSMSAPVEVIPNGLNADQLKISNQIYQKKIRAKFARSGALEIGYFSGSPSHGRDFGLIAPILAAIMEEEPAVAIRLVGYIDLHAALEPYRSRVEFHAFRDYVNLQSLIGSTEINVAPLAFSRFTNCKSDLKFFEAAAVGTLTVASDTDVFSASMQHGVTGLVAREHEWHKLLTQAVAIVRDTDRYADMAAKARDYTLATYAPEVQAQRLLAYFSAR
jgi:glycosyltransferase involved in cell wall biosynthesis